MVLFFRKEQEPFFPFGKRGKSIHFSMLCPAGRDYGRPNMT
jgi:hypothetical protein